MQPNTSPPTSALLHAARLHCLTEPSTSAHLHIPACLMRLSGFCWTSRYAQTDCAGRSATPPAFSESEAEADQELSLKVKDVTTDLTGPAAAAAIFSRVPHKVSRPLLSLSSPPTPPPPSPLTLPLSHERQRFGKRMRRPRGGAVTYSHVCSRILTYAHVWQGGGGDAEEEELETQARYKIASSPHTLAA
jgi:hypothetical protein